MMLENYYVISLFKQNKKNQKDKLIRRAKFWKWLKKKQTQFGYTHTLNEIWLEQKKFKKKLHSQKMVSQMNRKMVCYTT